MHKLRLFYELGNELRKIDARAQPAKKINAPANSSSLSFLFIYLSVFIKFSWLILSFRPFVLNFRQQHQPLHNARGTHMTG
jgi:hypothetical protein